MAKLNEKNIHTEKVVHLLTTSLCNRNCKYCCNKQYDLNDIPYVTDEELRNAKILCLTGGEPFLYTDPCEMAKYYKLRYPNIEKVYVYTNAMELHWWLRKNELHDIDGLNISIKVKGDSIVFEDLKRNESIKNLQSNLVYVFDNLYPIEKIKGFKMVERVWQEDFQAADDSIFRRC